MYLRRLPCMAVSIQDTRQAVCARVVIKFCPFTVLETETGQGRRGSRRGRAGVKGEWDEVRDACSRIYMDVDGCRCGCSRAAPSTSGWDRTDVWICAVHPWNRAYFVPMRACHLRSIIPSADRGRRNEVNVTGPDGKPMFCTDRMGGMISTFDIIIFFIFIIRAGT